MRKKPVLGGSPVAIKGHTDGHWVDQELSGAVFADERLGKRFRALLGQLSRSPGDSIPLVCQDWANTKAAYRFLDNDRVNEADILAGHFQATADRAAVTDGPLLVLHDTTEFSYQRDDIEALGKTRVGIAGAYRNGTPRYYTACGILMHSSLVVTPEGLPLGLAAIKFWSRKKFKGANALKKKINPTRVPIEEKESIRWLQNLEQSTAQLGDPARCVHIGDRESDIYELFCKAQETGARFLLRTCVDRRAGDSDTTVTEEMAEVPCKGQHRIEVRGRSPGCRRRLSNSPIARSRSYLPQTKGAAPLRSPSRCSMRSSAGNPGIAIRSHVRISLIVNTQNADRERGAPAFAAGRFLSTPGVHDPSSRGGASPAQRLPGKGDLVGPVHEPV